MTEVQGKPSIVAAKALLKGDPEGLRELVRAVLQEALEAEMSDALGAAKSERTTGQGHRTWIWAGSEPVAALSRFTFFATKLASSSPSDRNGRA